MYDALNDLIGGTHETDTFRELQLPLRTLDERKHTFGLGLYSAVATAPAAYIFSITQTRRLLTHMTNCAHDLALSDLWFADQSHCILTIYTKAGTVPQLDDIGIGEDAPSKKHLTSLITQKERESTPTGDDRTRAFRASLELPGAKDWVKAPPSPVLQTQVPNHLSRMWLKFYTRTPITDRTAQTCLRPKCSTVLDHFGDHLLICQCSSAVGNANRTSRHNRQVCLLAEDLGRSA